MSLAGQIQNLATRIATECKAIRALQGSLTSLTTTDKSSLVASINELKTSITAAAEVLDTAVAGDKTHTYSADKIITMLNQVKSDILGGAPAAYDTLMEIITQQQTDEGSITNLLTAMGNRVRFDAAQSLDSTQKAQACSNIGAVQATDVGDVTTNFVTTFEAGLV